MRSRSREAASGRAVDGVTHELARLFLVIATQNPIEFDGTYALPQAQLERFMVRLSLGYPSARALARSGGLAGRIRALAALPPAWACMDAALTRRGAPRSDRPDGRSAGRAA